MIKNVLKNKCYMMLIYLLILLFIIYITYYFYTKQNIKESFLGLSDKDDDNDDDLDLDDSKGEKKSYDVFPPLENKSKYDLLNNIFGINKDNNKNENIHNKNNHIDNDNNMKNIDKKDKNKDNNKNENREKNKDENKDEKEVNKGIKEFPIKSPSIQDKGKMELEKSEIQKSVSKLDESKPLMGKCDFYPNKCPNGMNMMGSLSGTNLKCGKNNSTKMAQAIAEIHSGHLSKINILDGGSGYNKENPPNIKIEGGKGNGASAIANVNSEGVIESIDIIDYGYNYIETPKILIEPPQLESVCYLCC